MAIASCSFASRVEGQRRAHPGDVGAGAERRPVAGQDDARSVGRLLAASGANGRRSSAISEASNALCRSGRARVTRATTPPGPVRSSRSESVTAPCYAPSLTVPPRAGDWLPLHPSRQRLNRSTAPIAGWTKAQPIPAEK